MIQTEFSAALNQVCAERGLEPEKVLEAVEEALLTAYLKDHPEVESESESFEVKLDPETGEARILKEGDDVTPSGFGRIAAQTAKQIIFQRVREAEKEALAGEYEKKIGAIVNGYIFRKDKGVVVLDLERTQGIMPPGEQVPGENYSLNQQLKVLVAEVREGPRGPEVIVSRSRPEFVKQLFVLEVPEIDSGTVVIEAVAREAGQRTKIAASSASKNVDPVGSLVGQKGVRVQSVIRELGHEKIDIIEYSADPARFIANALSPADVTSVVLDEETETATVSVPEDQLSLAIGKGGQNVRLAAKLTGWRIDIRGPEGQPLGSGVEGATSLEVLDLPTRVENCLEEAGFSTVEELASLSEEELSEMEGIGAKSIEKIVKALETADLEEAGEEDKESEDEDSENVLEEEIEEEGVEEEREPEDEEEKEKDVEKQEN
ncbi:MAG: transcription termination factor NusA [Patescibacteria group bacterium]|nr:transcription termination factor NusA [Patescibacteria group bacterium]